MSEEIHTHTPTHAGPMCHNPNMATQQNEAVLKESKQNVATTTREAVVEAEAGGG